MITTKELELKLIKHFDYVRNIIVPNVYWGFGLQYEADLVVLRKSGWCEEVEIKVSKSDLRAEKKKSHLAHNSNKFRKLWFAMPHDIIDENFIPEKSGILCLNENGYIMVMRKPKANKEAIKATIEEQLKLARLSSLRFWNMRFKYKDT